LDGTVKKLRIDNLKFSRSILGKATPTRIKKILNIQKHVDVIKEKL
jgi:hypothetical protein